VLQEDLDKDLEVKDFKKMNSLVRLDGIRITAVILSAGSSALTDAELELGNIKGPVDLETTASRSYLA